MCRQCGRRRCATDRSIEYVALRCSTIYGIRQSLRSNTARLIPESFDRIAKGLSPVIYGDGAAAYDFINVVDVARAHVVALRSSVKAGAFNVATGTSTPIDPRVRYLADRITRDQVKEIAEMKMLIGDIEQHGRRGDAPLPAGPASLTAESAQEAKDLASGNLLKDEPL